MNRIVSVTFVTNLQRSSKKNANPRFTVPLKVTRALGLHSGEWIGLAIWKPSGEPLYFGEAQLKSGTEIYDKQGIGNKIKRIRTILVTAAVARQ
jgi:hypothetical protein